MNCWKLAETWPSVPGLYEDARAGSLLHIIACAATLGKLSTNESGSVWLEGAGAGRESGGDQGVPGAVWQQKQCLLLQSVLLLLLPGADWGPSGQSWPDLTCPPLCWPVLLSASRMRASIGVSTSLLTHLHPAFLYSREIFTKIIKKISWNSCIEREREMIK